MPSLPHYTRPKKSHPGSSREDILNEPDWFTLHNHRIGLRDRNDRVPGLTHTGDEWDEELSQFLEQAKKEAQELGQALTEHDLVTVRDFMEKQEVRCYFTAVGDTIELTGHRTIISECRRNILAPGDMCSTPQKTLSNSSRTGL